MCPGPRPLPRLLHLLVRGGALIGLLAPMAAAAADEPIPVEEPIAPDGFAAELEAAKDLYFQGDLEGSLLAFRALQFRYATAPELVPVEEAFDALTYLGEILVKLGEDDEASRVFRTILERDVSQTISPYHHPAEVVFVFNRVREQVVAEMAAEIPEEPVIPPAPATTWLPLGLPQLSRGRVGPGLFYGGAQVATAGLAIGTYLHLRTVNTGPSEVHPLEWTDEQVVRRTQSRRYLVQWPATFAFYGLWLASSVEAHGHWRRTHRDQPRATVLPWLQPPLPDQRGGFVGVQVVGTLHAPTTAPR